MTGSFQVMEEAEEFYFPGNETGVLVIHGFTGTTQSMRYIGEQLGKPGFTVYGPRLTGHGTAPEDMEKASYEDWIQNVEMGLTKLQKTCSSIFVLGLSMGGTLTLYLAEHHPELKGIIPINAATEMSDMMTQYQALSREGTRFVEGIGSDIKKQGVEESAYAKTPVLSMGELITLTKQVRANLSSIKAPALIFSSSEDHVVPPENSREIYDSILSKNRAIEVLKNSYHVATLDHDKEFIAERSIAFIQSVQ